MRRLIFSILACFLFVQLGYSQGKSVVKCQYWIGSNGYDKAVTNAVKGQKVSFSIDTQELSLGIHNLYFRFQDSDGIWSGLQSWLFCVNEMKMNKETKITKGEYWIDNNNEKQDINVSNEQVALILDVSKLNDGMHTLNYRVRDNEGKYSPLQTWIFFKNSLHETSIQNKTASVEYWFDDKANVLQSYIASNDTINFSVDATRLKTGLHTLNYRVKDILGNYSRIHTWAFFKTDSKPTKISWYKYWWNNNEDKAIKENVENDNAEFIFKKELKIPMYAMTDGYSNNSITRFYIVFGDDMGNISNIEWTDISYPDVIPPVSVIEADKEQVNESVTLKWRVTNDQVEDYNIYYSENDQPFVLWLPNTTKETANFRGHAGASYRFTVTARDKAGNKERFEESKHVKVMFKSN